MSDHDDLARQAAEWLVLLSADDAGERADAERGYQRWKQQGPAHVAAAQDMEGLLVGLRDMRQQPASDRRLHGVIDGEIRFSQRSRRNKRFCAALGIGLMLLVPGWLGWQQHGLDYQQQLHTGLGERRQVELPDGSRLEINGRTRLEVRFSAGQRDIRLEQGEVMFSVAHDSSRPFVVDAGNGTVTVTGTRFDVRRDPGQTRVAVEQGSVRVEGHGESRALLGAGLGSHIDEEGNVAAAYRIDAAALTAWRSGKLVFNDASLAQVAEEVSRYREHPLKVAPKAAKLRLSSTFRVDDTDALLRALPSILPVTVVAHADGSQEIIAK